MDTRALGMAVVSMGGGRRRASDNIDYAVGLTGMISLGEEAGTQKPLAMVHVRNDAQFEEAEKSIQQAIVIGSGAAEEKSQVFRRIRLEDVS